jgi:hypothetical protein
MTTAMISSTGSCFFALRRRQTKVGQSIRPIPFEDRSPRLSTLRGGAYPLLNVLRCASPEVGVCDLPSSIIDLANRRLISHERSDTRTRRSQDPGRAYRSGNMYDPSSVQRPLGTAFHVRQLGRPSHSPPLRFRPYLPRWTYITTSSRSMQQQCLPLRVNREAR